ncbi:MAG: heparan-alpha-glucosaminide N-acetyltransferase domain-containing protein [Actinobacteria bacterium]|nr:heparan-alpha-glucosaminide N-acetyltransferase domain-containing protein [Actinomycetota bacterium]
MALKRGSRRAVEALGNGPEGGGRGRIRVRSLDAARGLAVVLMIVDHVAAVMGSNAGPLWWVRHTVTRPALPLFMVVAGILIARRRSSWSWRRLVAIAGAGVVATWLLLVSGIQFGPDVLLVLVATCPAWGVLSRRPLELLVLGLLQALYLPIGWGGYEPGLVLAYLGVGILAGGCGERLSWIRGRAFELVGRYPLTWYLGHLVVLGLVVKLT